ncbi:hypothetical protein BB561_004541 [Smittium simulii]|uniref:N-acetyl-D-glucosamine kinase n=1 Tax=Smittium simulii TaxID=133385 RepID=A0A2T9YFS8_9FUNG|nr:hypothetical protein BB561_004541 [Smittium simulii]
MSTSENRDFFSVLDKLKTETRNPKSMNIDTLSTKEMLKIINDEDKTVALAVEAILDQITAAVDGIAERMAKGGRILYFGAGTSGRLGVLDASECPPTYSTHPDLVVGIMAGGDAAIRVAQENVEDSVETGKEDCRKENITAIDTVVGIAASGRTPYVIGALDYARQVGALTIGVSTNAVSTLNECVDIILAAEVGPEVVTGSTRMKSGTAQKLILNMLTTGAMIKLGKTYGNLMVDFKPTNEKLRLRAPKIVCEVTGVTRDEALEALSKCGGQVKIAIMSIITKTNPEQAAKLLEDNGNILVKAIDSHKQTTNSSTTTEESDPEMLPVIMTADGGGTKTLIYLVDLQGNEVGQATVESTNYSSVSLDMICQRISNGLDLAIAGRKNIKVVKSLVGLAGIGDPAKTKILQDKLQNLSPNLTVITDIKLVSTGLPKSTADSLSVSVIAGTGSATLAELPDGTVEVCGGWGPVLGDQGSGTSLGSNCLRAVSAAIEKAGPDTLMVECVRSKWNVQQRLDFVRYVQALRPDQARVETAKLAEIVLDCAYNKQDPVALEIVKREVLVFSNFVTSLLRKHNASSVNIAVTGSVIVKSEAYRNDFIANIESQGFKINVLNIVDVPAISAAKSLVGTPL